MNRRRRKGDEREEELSQKGKRGNGGKFENGVNWRGTRKRYGNLVFVLRIQ